MQSEHEVEAADSPDDALALKTMLRQLAQAGVMADGNDGAAKGVLLGKLAHEGRDEVEMVADDHLRAEGHDSLGELRLEGRLELREHLRCEVAVARRGIRHLVGHAADVEGELGCVEAHRKDRDAVW